MPDDQSYQDAQDMQSAVFCSDYPWDDPEHNPLRAAWYNLNDMIAKAIIPALTQMIDNCHGFPSELLGEDLQRRAAKDFDDQAREEWAQAAQEWIEILKQIRAGFEAHNQMMDLSMLEFPNKEAYYAREEELRKVRDKGLALFNEYFENLWD